MTDYTESSKIVGTFLPKIYTRRITLEDSNIVDHYFVQESQRQQDAPYYYESSVPGLVPDVRQLDLSSINNPIDNLRVVRTVTPSTAVTVDYHIKDLLTESGLGIITKNSDGDGDQLQNQILSALKVVLMVFKDTQVAESVYNSFGFLSTTAQTAFNTQDFPSIKDYVQQFGNSSTGILVREIPGRPIELDFQSRNSRYQQYDINNNPINIIPYKHTFNIDNEKWDNCKNLSLIAFTYFDFESLQLGDLMSQDDIDKLSWLMGEISYENITTDGEIESTSILFRDFQTNEPYYGPVHRMQDGRFMSGIAHGAAGGGRVLTRTRIPMRKIQDFRKVQRSKLVNYQPGSLESFSSVVPSLSILEKQNKNFFGLENVLVDLDRTTRSTDIEFSVNFADIYKMNSRYQDIFKNLNNFEKTVILQSMKISSIQVLRKRVTRQDIGNTKMGFPKKVDFDQLEVPVHEVARSGQPRPGLGFITPFQSESGVLIQQSNPEAVLDVATSQDYYKTFYANDLQISDMWDSRGVYQYGVKITVEDNTKNLFMEQIRRARQFITSLKMYLSECQIPVFDTRKVRKVDESTMTSLDLFSEPEYSRQITQQGNYDSSTATFTREFVDHALQKYFTDDQTIENIAENYLRLVRYTFGMSHVSLATDSVNILQGENTNMLQPESTETLLERDGVYNWSTSRRVMINMIHPLNTRPELLQSFILFSQVYYLFFFHLPQCNTVTLYFNNGIFWF